MEELKTKLEEIKARQAKERAMVAGEYLGAVIDAVTLRTEKWAKEQGFSRGTEEVEKLSLKGRAIYTFLDKTDFGCYAASVRELSSLLLGEELPSKPNKDVNYRVGTVVVPIENTNGHNYEIGQPAICYLAGSTGAGRHLSVKRPTEGSGNNMEYTSKALRPATPEEIAAFLPELLVEGNDATRNFILKITELTD
jgi:hypothetical protein